VNRQSEIATFDVLRRRQEIDGEIGDLDVVLSHRRQQWTGKASRDHEAE